MQSKVTLQNGKTENHSVLVRKDGKKQQDIPNRDPPPKKRVLS